jgi:hypothetical protein
MTYEDDHEDQDDAEEHAEGACDQCTGSTAEDLKRAMSGASITPVCACAIGQGASSEDCVCGPEQTESEEQ